MTEVGNGSLRFSVANQVPFCKSRNMTATIWIIQVTRSKLPRSSLGRSLAFLSPTSFVLRHELGLLDRYLSRLSKMKARPPSDPDMLISVFESLGTNRDRRRLREGMNGKSTTFSFTLGNIITVVSHVYRYHEGDPHAILREVTATVTEIREIATHRYSEHLSFRWV